jgi:hypothetical protein
LSYKMPSSRFLGARRAICAAVLLLQLGLLGCSTLTDVAGVPKAGYQPTGSYVLSAEDQRLDCRRLRERSDSLLDQLKALPMRAAQEIQEVPATMALFVGRVIGDSTTGVAAVAEFDKGRAEAAALNEARAQKGCGTLDLDAELSGANAEMATLKSQSVISTTASEPAKP